MFCSDEGGQDLIEYALLASFLGFGAVVGINLLSDAMNSTYSSWDNAAQSDALVEVPDPQ
jgi:Flp pilus assembly pilin Flp